MIASQLVLIIRSTAPTKKPEDSSDAVFVKEFQDCVEYGARASDEAIMAAYGYERTEERGQR